MKRKEEVEERKRFRELKTEIVIPLILPTEVSQFGQLNGN